MRKENILKIKSFDFAIRIVKLYKFLKEKQNEYILINQVLRSGTSVGALVRESENASSTKDFVHKLTIALKEADENNDAEELVKLLVASIKTVKTKLEN